MSIPEPQGDDLFEIRLILPALAPYARVARLAMTGLATRSGFTYDEVEDLRIAVGEVFGMLVGTARADDRVRWTCLLTDDALRLVAERVPPGPLDEVGELSTAILGAVADEATVDARAGRITVVKRSEGSP